MSTSARRRLMRDFKVRPVGRLSRTRLVANGYLCRSVCKPILLLVSQPRP